MRKIVLLFVFVSISFSSLPANDLPDELNPIHFRIGGFIMTKASISTLTIEGYKNQPAWAPLGDIGISLLFLHRGNFGFVFNLLRSNYSYGIYPYVSDDSNKDVTTITNTTMTFSPMLYIGGFVIGYNYHLSAITKRDGNSFNQGSTNTVGEIIAGGFIPLYSDEMGSFNLNIMGSYMLDEIITKVQPVSFSIGFSYLFNAAKYWFKIIFI